ncbi:MAG: hypothetical protein MJK14_04975, partial [Rivularia sp. ALOHA_DT_140]|nr:hypothetical protein [Rivularia sp. ALOHA_DT_140]
QREQGEQREEKILSKNKVLRNNFFLPPLPPPYPDFSRDVENVILAASRTLLFSSLIIISL